MGNKKNMDEIYLDVVIKKNGEKISAEQVAFFTNAEIKNFKDVLKVLNKKVMKLALTDENWEIITLKPNTDKEILPSINKEKRM